MVRAFSIVTLALAMLFVVTKINSPHDLHTDQNTVFAETEHEQIPEWDLLLIEEEPSGQKQSVTIESPATQNSKNTLSAITESKYDDEFLPVDSVTASYTTNNSAQLFIENKLKMYLQERKQQRQEENAFRPGSRNNEDTSFRPGSRNDENVSSFRPGTRNDENISSFRPGSHTENKSSFRPGSSSTFRPGSQKFRPGSVKSFRPGSVKSFRPGAVKSFRPGGIVFDTAIRHPQLEKMSVEDTRLVFLSKTGEKVYFQTSFSNEELQRLAIAVKEWDGFALSQNNTAKGCYTFSHPLLYGTSIIDIINELDTLTGEIYYGSTRRSALYGKYKSKAPGYRSVMDDLHAFLREDDIESAKILLLEYFNFFDGNPATFTKQNIATAIDNNALVIDKQILALELFPSLCDSNSMYRAVSPQELFTQEQFIHAHSAVALFNKNNMNYAQDVRMEKAIEIAQIVGLFLGYTADLNFDAKSFVQKQPEKTYEPQVAFGYSGALYNRIWSNLTSQEKQNLRHALDSTIETMRQIPKQSTAVSSLQRFLIPQIWRKVNSSY